MGGSQPMFVVIPEEPDWEMDFDRHAVRTIEQAFAQVCCRAGLNYHFEPDQDGWQLILTDGERPECSPDPIKSDFRKRDEAQRDLMRQAVDGRLKGWAAVPLGVIKRQLASAPLAAE